MLDKDTRTKEHVVGRRFVPTGSTENRWNLILWACGPCNRRKADLEDDIAAITMHFHTVGLAGMTDATAQAEAARRGQHSGSRKTGKPVGSSHESMSVETKLGPAELKIAFVAPPQLDDSRAWELARLQMTSFFYLLTYEPARNVGHYWPGGFFPLHGVLKSDWGNPVQRSYMKTVAAWDHRLVLHTADGYYYAAIRRHPSADLWSWALEWNKSYRLVGLFGDTEAAKAVANSLPSAPVHTIQQGPNSFLRFRLEEALPEQDDILFKMPDD